ncbi:hypothetical protein MYX65_03205 [Acidobacteria bacterium AH-259-L09]|nr:hypothetical protein [Acidobacteria bacterium AH-259-L09]
MTLRNRLRKLELKERVRALEDAAYFRSERLEARELSGIYDVPQPTSDNGDDSRRPYFGGRRVRQQTKIHTPEQHQLPTKTYKVRGRTITESQLRDIGDNGTKARTLEAKDHRPHHHKPKVEAPEPKAQRIVTDEEVRRAAEALRVLPICPLRDERRAKYGLEAEDDYPIIIQKIKRYLEQSLD